MTTGRLVKSAVFSVILTAWVGLLPGCGMGPEEIPLAKVPPPPESFLTGGSKAKVPKGASPANATELRR